MRIHVLYALFMDYVIITSCIMYILISPSQTWARNCAFDTANDSCSSLTVSSVFLLPWTRHFGMYPSLAENNNEKISVTEPEHKSCRRGSVSVQCRMRFSISECRPPVKQRGTLLCCTGCSRGSSTASFSRAFKLAATLYFLNLWP